MATKKRRRTYTDADRAYARRWHIGIAEARRARLAGKRIRTVGRAVLRRERERHETPYRNKANWFAKKVAAGIRSGLNFKQAVKKAKKRRR